MTEVVVPAHATGNSFEVGMQRIPMVVLGGWLGAGKTTLVNRLLQVADGERIAVVVNDIGEVNLDAELIATRDGDTVELTNGCVCCSIGDSLAVTLRDLVLAERSTGRPLDRLVVEASGVAEPDRVAAYGDRRRIRPDGIVVVVDATDVVQRANDSTYGPLVVRQVRVADLLVVTKTDLVLDGGIGVREWCAAVAPGVPVVVADFAGPDHWVRSILGGLAWNPTEAVAFSTSQTSPESLDVPVETSTWRAPGRVDVDHLATVLHEIRQLVGPGMLRAKAVVESLDRMPTAVHLAAGRVSKEPIIKSVPGSPSGVLVVVTAPGVLSSPDVAAALNTVLIPDESPPFGEPSALNHPC
ncbi:MAG: GTP-binding protein [Acidimicrobiales bacterium]|nr:GTP-binding protein [Acidimicrobiales bacterium]